MDARYFRRVLENFRKYSSFTTLDDEGQRKRYDLAMSKTATGLLRDFAATTSRLTAELKKEKEYTVEVFAAYCMHILATKWAKWDWKEFNDHAAVEAMGKACMYTAKWLKEDFDENKLKGFKGVLIWNAENRSTDIFRKNAIRIKGINERTGKKETQYIPRFESLVKEAPDGEEYLHPEVLDSILATAARAMATDASKATVDEALVGCLRNKTLTQEQAKILCWRS